MTETNTSYTIATTEPLLALLLILLGAFMGATLLYLYHRREQKKWAKSLAEEQERRQEQDRGAIAAQARIASLESTLAKAEEMRAEQRATQQELFDKQLAAMRAQFTALSEEITQKRSEELSTSNKKNIDALLTPLREQIKQMGHAFEENKKSSTEQTGILRGVIEQLMQQTVQVGAQADGLAKALRQESKMQGNWGEHILERLLEMESLKKGIHYSTQEMLKGAEGNRLIPDVILHYPDGKDLIIDAKVSLTAYTNFFNAEDPQEKEQHLRDHLTSVKAHIKELARKEYYKYVQKPRKALEYVVMFMPIEGAMEMALEAEPDLWQSALDQGVFLANNRNLLVILRLISVVWRQHDQERNIDEIIKQTELLVQRITDFSGEFETIKTRLQQLDDAYEKANRRLRGREGFYNTARRLQELGVKNNSKKQLPEPTE